MAEYIERDAVMQAFADYVWHSNHSDFVSAPRWNHAVDIVKDFPAADVVPVVRCKNCDIHRYCKVSQYLGADGFCSKGEKGG